MRLLCVAKQPSLLFPPPKGFPALTAVVIHRAEMCPLGLLVLGWVLGRRWVFETFSSCLCDLEAAV